MSSTATPQLETPVSTAINNLAKAIEATIKPPDKKDPLWNSLEITKLVVSILMSVLLFYFGTAVTNSQEREKSLTKARIDSYDRIKDDLNRIHCFMLEVGTWKEESPSTMIGYKRAIDREMNEERAIWSPQTFQAYSEFDRAVFAHTGVSGDDAAIRADVGQKHNSPSWNSATDDAKLRPPDLNYKEKYKNLYDSLQNDITKQ